MPPRFLLLIYICSHRVIVMPHLIFYTNAIDKKSKKKSNSYIMLRQGFKNKKIKLVEFSTKGGRGGQR